MAYAIFKMNVLEDEHGVIQISYTTMMRLDDNSKRHIIQADSDEEAVTKAANLLAAAEVETHVTLGDPDLVLCPYPRYFVGELHFVMDPSPELRQTYHIHQFVPIPKKI